ncbi:hypothetical protein, conserved [Trypanosoma brucei gambiense DAL972]|uniref:T. brucei spp.-specific protein n=2 Tax=Trypanosoma brucei TaxID=5691 RepID=C9ZKF3_TRYB9|nr:hypothetical protein, conserved [Trypanosoma brucei gambiense DAL972]XP_011772211.1 hypothetical protein, conserved [Trypanosoma brucei gambiense DAL972]RHW73570.1 hypothetical protein DPX39_030024600 [Trypanosoma brucei equiperdum]RHW73763.1 hypothetical protein DPX39_030024700 [Trypanosoma brucei equiperdum]CBH09919.1 hypothetical protein, conserved [Trypanosoma brucei gambiense DAL972]CBH09920.1 hypothetical protein, conserved [Trypanosoma brucei gambiense DAL972]|eukprot:XP_011772210.1 hypothetical protein, conserved [Trypanosoma brucei gambiense DAL972]
MLCLPIILFGFVQRVAMCENVWEGRIGYVGKCTEVLGVKIPLTREKEGLLVSYAQKNCTLEQRVPSGAPAEGNCTVCGGGTLRCPFNYRCVTAKVSEFLGLSTPAVASPVVEAGGDSNRDEASNKGEAPPSSEYGPVLSEEPVKNGSAVSATPKKEENGPPSKDDGHLKSESKGTVSSSFGSENNGASSVRPPEQQTSKSQPLQPAIYQVFSSVLLLFL